MEWKKVEVRDEDGNGFVFIEKDGLVMPSIFQRADPDTRLKQIKEFKLSKDDVLICSYPKTGTHWVSNLVYFLTTNGSLDDVATTSPTLIELLPSEKWEMVAKSTVLASHFKPDRLPSDLLVNGGKVIVVNRNPKDTCVSCFNYLPKMKTEMKYGDQISWKRFFEGWVNGEIIYGTYFDYYNAWEKEIKVNSKLDVLIVHFDKLKLDGLKEMQRIQEFLGLSHPQERLQKILDKCAIMNMKTDAESGKVPKIILDKNGKSILFRKGEVGDWKNYFTVAQSEYLDKIVEKAMKDNLFLI